MTLSRKIRSAVIKPYKATENKVIPIVNSINNYLDILFPQDKWNWRKIAIGWAAIQAIVITILEVYVAYKNVQQVNYVNKYYITINDRYTIELLSVADSLTVYHMIFIVAQFFQFYYICDTVSKSSTLQLIPGTIFSLGMTAYSVVQYSQAIKGTKVKYIQDMIEMDPDSSSKIHQAKLVEILIIVLMCIFSIGWIIITLRLYKVFGWNVFKQLGADIGVKNRLKLYQILLAFLKIDIFFFTAFTIQFFIFVMTYISKDESLKIRFINITLLILCFVMPFLGFAATKNENYKLMFGFIVLLSISIGYMVYNLSDIMMDRKNLTKCDESTNICTEVKYRNCSNSLSIACISSIILGISTFILSLVNFKNFPKGLKKDKSIHPPTSHNSTLSSSYNTPKRWSIE